MKLRKSLATQDWRVYHNPVGSNSPNLCYWIHEYINGEMVRSILMPPLNKADAHAIAALPKLYAALEFFVDSADNEESDAWDLQTCLDKARAALYAVNCADEQATE